MISGREMMLEDFDRQARSGKGGWVGMSSGPYNEMDRINRYIEAAGYPQVPMETVPSVMVLGIVRDGLFGRPFPVPRMVEELYSSFDESNSNHEQAFYNICAENKVRAFRPHSFWLGFVITGDADRPADTESYHLVFNTYGTADGLRPQQRRAVAKKLIGGLGSLGACVVIEDAESIFDARTGKSIPSHQAGIDFSVPC